MATTAPDTERVSMTRFRDSLIREAGARETAERLCRIGRYRALGRGEILPSDPEDDQLVYLASGAAKLIVRSAGDGQLTPRSAQILAFHFPGEIVSVLSGRESRLCLAALCDTEMVVFSADAFLKVAEGDPAVIRAVLVRALDALQRSRLRMMQLGFRSARQRVAGFLVSIARRLGADSAGPCELTLPMSRGDIAHSLGLTLETISRQFADLRAEGLLSTCGRNCVVLTDLAALARAAGQEPPKITKIQI